LEPASTALNLFTFTPALFPFPPKLPEVTLPHGFTKVTVRDCLFANTAPGPGTLTVI
jgi:hypothetical protein